MKESGKHYSITFFALSQVLIECWISAAIGMPDLHPGNRFPIGCAVAAHGVYPALICTDVGCGIALYRLASTPSRLVPSKIAAQLTRLDDPWEGDTKEWLKDRGVEKESEFDKGSLGTVGAGNHFAEVCVVESVKDPARCEELGGGRDVSPW